MVWLDSEIHSESDGTLTDRSLAGCYAASWNLGRTAGGRASDTCLMPSRRSGETYLPPLAFPDPLRFPMPDSRRDRQRASRTPPAGGHGGVRRDLPHVVRAARRDGRADAARSGGGGGARPGRDARAVAAARDVGRGWVGPGLPVSGDAQPRAQSSSPSQDRAAKRAGGSRRVVVDAACRRGCRRRRS